MDDSRRCTGSVEQLGKAFERVWKASVEDNDLSYFVGLESAVDFGIQALFTALMLYRRAFATDLHPECGSSSTLLSPPSNPTLTTRSVMHQAPPVTGTASTCRCFSDDYIKHSSDLRTRFNSKKKYEPA